MANDYLNVARIRWVNEKLAEGVSAELRDVLVPLLREVESLMTSTLRSTTNGWRKSPRKRTRKMFLLKQVKGVGTQIALTYILTIEDPYRFREESRGGLFSGVKTWTQELWEERATEENQQRRRPVSAHHAMVQGAHYILGPFGEDSDLRRWGLKLAERGGKNAKKRAVVAVARKLAVLLHRLWVGGEVYEPLRNSQKAMRAVA